MKKLLILALFSCLLNGQIYTTTCQNFSLKENVNYSCGFIEAPYDHFNLNQEKIDISFVVIDKQKKDKLFPLAILTGGPGGSAITESRLNYWLNSPLSDDRDVIIFDQRGIGYSSKLKNLNNDFFSIFSMNLDFDQEKIKVEKLLNNYVDNSNKLGINLTLYNTFQSASDLNLIMSNLGYEKYSLYGSSYGTRLGRVIQ